MFLIRPAFRKISVTHQIAQEFAIEVNDRVTGFLQRRLERHRQSGFSRRAVR